MNSMNSGETKGTGKTNQKKQLPWEGDNEPKNLVELYVLLKTKLHKVRVEQKDGTPMPLFPKGTTLTCEYVC